MNTMTTMQCQSECPAYPGLTCNLVDDHDTHYAMGESWPAADPAGLSQTDQDVDNRCRFCEQPVRWSTAYDEPHWVHVKAIDTIACPQYSGSYGSRPAADNPLRGLINAFDAERARIETSR